MRLSLLWMLGLAITSVVGAAWSDEVIWRIGVDDGNYGEFAIAGHYETILKQFPADPVLAIGKDDPAVKWPYVQAGPTDGWGGSRSHTNRIEFDLPRIASDHYLLAIHLVDTQSTSPPSVTVQVNDHSQGFRLPTGGGDESLTDARHGRHSVIECYLRREDLHEGRNTVSITTTAGSWMIYDAVTFSSCTVLPPAARNLALTNTYLMKKHGDGLTQITDLSMDLTVEQSGIHVEATGDGINSPQDFRDLPAGHVTVPIEIPAVATAQPVHVKIAIGAETFDLDTTVQPQKKWRIYILPSTHLDIGYTDVQDHTMAVHRENLIRAIGWCAKYPGFKWNLEGSLVAEDYLSRAKDPSEFVKLVKAGRIGIMGFYGNELTGICSSEELSRLFDNYDRYRHDYGIDTQTAMLTDVPGMVGTIPMILAGHGIKYLGHGINATRARGDQPMYDTPHYWEGFDGSRVLMWKTAGYGQCEPLLGPDPAGNIDFTTARIGELLDRFTARKDYPYDAILVYGAYSDNRENAESLASIFDKWNATYEYPKVIFSRGQEFFQYIESNFADKLPVVKGDSGVWWEDGAGSSAHETAITRVAKERLLTAEKLISLCDKSTAAAMAKPLADAWRDALMYDEHTWGAAGSVSEPYAKQTQDQWAVKRAFADRAVEAANGLADRVMGEFCGAICSKEDAIAVFNPSGWARSEWVEISDASGARKMLYAKDVPSLGYKLFPLGDAKTDSPADIKDPVLENRHYRITFDPATGAIASLYDKDLRREMVEPSSYGLNAYLYAAGPDDKPVISTAAMPRFVPTRLPGRRVMRITSDAPVTNGLETEVILYDDVKRIDFTNKMYKIAKLDKEAGYFAFPFAFTKPSIRIEVPDGVMRPDIDQMKGADRDWYCAQHFVTVSDDKAAVVWTALDSPLLTVQDINRARYATQWPIENGRIFAYVFNNYWFTNYRAAQEGSLTFRFSMTSGKSFSDTEAKQFGESVQSPLIARIVTAKSGAESPREKSYVKVEGDGIVLQSMMPARFTSGRIIRLRNMTDKDANATLTIAAIPCTKAYLCNLAEDKLETIPIHNGQITVPLKPLNLATVLLER